MNTKKIIAFNAAFAVATTMALALITIVVKPTTPVLPDTAQIEAVCAAKGMTVQRSEDDVQGGVEFPFVMQSYESVTICEDAAGNGVAVHIQILTRSPVDMSELEDTGEDDPLIDEDALTARAQVTL